MKKSILPLLITLSFPSFALTEEACLEGAMEPPAPVGSLLGVLRAASQGQFRKAMDLKVNHDGQGSLGVHYEQGQPKLLRLYYKNEGGEKSEVLSFDEMSKGKEISYEHQDMKGKAIIVRAARPFENKGKYRFEMKLRSKINPDSYTTHIIDFAAHPEKQAMLKDNKIFKQMVISPGIKMLSWDGTFKKVEFK